MSKISNDIGTPLLTLAGNLVKGVPVDLDPDTIEHWNDNCGELHAELHRLLRRENPAQRILSPFIQMTLPAREDPFIVNQKYVVDTSEDAVVNISYVDSEILNDATVIAPRGEVILSRSELLLPASFRELNEVVSGPAIELDQVWGMVKLQAKGEEGALLNDGKANLFPKAMINGKVRALDVYWDDDGWRFHVRSVAFRYRWGAGRQSVFRNS